MQVAFSQRRKLLRHTLGEWLEARQFAGDFDVQRRAEEVPVAEYVALAQARHEKPVRRFMQKAAAAASAGLLLMEQRARSRAVWRRLTLLRASTPR